MRRLRDRTASTLFRGTELPRLLTLMVMLGVLVLLIDLAREPQTWRWLVPDANNAEQADAGAQALAMHGPNVVAPEPDVAGPADEDPHERDAAREEFQAITDKAPLGGEEMPAYWRMMSWQQRQKTGELLARARKDVTFNELFRRPDAWRGKLVQFPVHVQQSVAAEDLADNPLGLTTVHEVWGWNSDSQPYWYWLVVPNLPPGMPTGKDLAEEATFVGYFLKLLPYEDHRGKTLVAPLLIGRLVWHPSPDNPLARGDEWTWPWYAAAALAVLFVIRWSMTVGVRAAGGSGADAASESDPISVEAWLDEAENAEDDVWDAQDASNYHDDVPPWEITGPQQDNQ